MAASDNPRFGGGRGPQPGSGHGGGPASGAAPIMPPRPSDAARPAIERPGIERPPAPHAAEPPAAPRSAPRRNETEQRTLIVGREISLSGEITSCDRLVVEGSVEANLANCREIDIAESGLFKGTASIDDAEIRGRFEGTLIARQHLHIRSTGKVTATVSYAEVEIEPGGQLSGTVQVLSKDAGSTTGGGTPGGSTESPRLPR